MTPEEAKQKIVSLFREIELAGLNVDIESDYGSDTRIDISNPNLTSGHEYWDTFRQVRFGDYHE